MTFLSDLGSIVNDQFGFGENNVTSLNSGNRVADFGRLGEFAKKFDKTSERTYIEDGFIRNVRPRLRQIVHQQPDITVVFKKRMFSSLKENFRPDLLEEKERLFIRASKILIQNKCKLIAAYERLTKIEQVSKESGQFNTALLPMALESINVLETFGSKFIKSEDKSDLERVRKMLSLVDSSDFTSYITYNDSPFRSTTGEGDGVFELTTIASVNTSISNELGAGNASLSIEDPYKLLIVTDDDIEAALNDASNFFKQNPFMVLSENELERQIEALKTELNDTRRARGASEIKFFINSETVISKRVRAVISANGQEVQFNYNSGLVGLGSSVDLWEAPNLNQADAFESLSSNRAGNLIPVSERDLFKDIIKNIFLLLGFKNTTQNRINEANQDANHARIKLRRFFADLPIIQPVDVVSIYLTTRTTEDPKLTQGFNNLSLGGFQIGQTFDRLLNNMSGLIDNFAGKNNDIDQLEKNAIVGPGFPMWLWRQVRNPLTRQSAGTAIFVGLVKSVSSDYSDGKYMLSVDCEDNAGYFTKSQVNFKPSLDVFNQELYDPLTPFDISFDASTGVPITDINTGNYPPLLPENERLLNSRSTKFNTGTHKGQKTSVSAYQLGDGEVSGENVFRTVLHNPNGMVYRWKQGIQALTKIERAYPDSSERRETSPLLTKNPFAGQDVMNVLSLLVTGQPYSYNSFLKAAIANANTLSSTDPSENKDTSTSYLDALLDDLSRRNVVWGNFVPFKQLVMNEEADAFIRSGQADFIKTNNNIRQLKKRAAQLQDDLALMGSEFARNNDPISIDADGQIGVNGAGSTATSSNEEIIRTELANIQIELGEEFRRFQNTVDNLYASSIGGNITIFGDDISLNPSYNEAGNDVSNAEIKLSKREFRRRLGSLTLRRLWAVKGNEDRNFFVVDDQYDKNFDIQAFERKIGASLNLFSSEFSTIEDQIKVISKLLGLEVFADSQGHILVRPPKYNNVPSSVFYRMLREKDRRKFRIFPEFLESLFYNQIQSLIKAVEITEDQIRLLVIALGVDTTRGDSEIENYLSRGENLEGTKSSFKFLSDGDTGKVATQPFQSAIDQTRPDNLEDRKLLPLKSTINVNLSNKRLFDQESRLAQAQRLKLKDARSQATADRIFQIRRRLLTQQSFNAPTFQQLYSNERFSKVNAGLSQLDKLNINDQISRLVSERQRLLMSLSNSIRNLEEGQRINADGSNDAQSALTPFLNSQKEIPDILEHMIQDEDNDDLGPNSGKRFVLNDKNIVSYKISENPPDYTLVQVNGLFGEGGFLDPPSSLTTSSGGNTVTSAYAVDYFMWEKYGFRATNSVEAPYFTDPASQCAPFAVFLLNLARKNILQGSVTINGYNEFYQVGDVVYLEDRDLLFYVTSVSHSFSYGSLSTSLTLKYGHKPGEYIPTILDIVGKILYNGRGISGSYRNSRKTSINGEESLGVIIYDDTDEALLRASGNSGEIAKVLLAGKQGARNRKVLSSALLSVSGLVNSRKSKRKKPVIAIRYYHTDDIAANKYLEEAANGVRQLLVSPQKNDENNNQRISDSQDSESGGFRINASDVVIQPINADNTTLSPSDTAWNVARSLEEERYGGDSIIDDNPNEPSRLEKVLFETALDLWLSYIDIEEVVEQQSDALGGQLGQQDLADNVEIDLARIGS